MCTGVWMFDGAWCWTWDVGMFEGIGLTWSWTREVLDKRNDLKQIKYEQVYYYIINVFWTVRPCTIISVFLYT